MKPYFRLLILSYTTMIGIVCFAVPGFVSLAKAQNRGNAEQILSIISGKTIYTETSVIMGKSRTIQFYDHNGNYYVRSGNNDVFLGQWEVRDDTICRTVESIIDYCTYLEWEDFVYLFKPANSSVDKALFEYIRGTAPGDQENLRLSVQSDSDRNFSLSPSLTNTLAAPIETPTIEAPPAKTTTVASAKQRNVSSSAASGNSGASMLSTLAKPAITIFNNDPQAKDSNKVDNNAASSGASAPAADPEEFADLSCYTTADRVRKFISVRTSGRANASRVDRILAKQSFWGKDAGNDVLIYSEGQPVKLLCGRHGRCWSGVVGRRFTKKLPNASACLSDSNIYKGLYHSMRIK